MNYRHYLPVALIALFALTAMSSLTIRTGHADVPVADSAELINPLVSGDKAPRFVVRDVDGESFDFDPSQLERPAVLLTFRGGWCPYCNTYLSEMRHVIPKIRELGVDVLFLSGDRPGQLYESLSQETQKDIDGLNYTLLSDAEAQAATALGIAFRASDMTINRRHEKGQDIDGSSMMNHGVLPVPAVFAVDRHGVIRFAFTNADYKVRLPADKLLAAAEAIAAAD
jgi:peroxiredoxin